MRVAAGGRGVLVERLISQTGAIGRGIIRGPQGRRAACLPVCSAWLGVRVERGQAIERSFLQGGIVVDIRVDGLEFLVPKPDCQHCDVEAVSK